MTGVQTCALPICDEAEIEMVDEEEEFEDIEIEDVEEEEILEDDE
mgnify:CR=1 FL=1